MSHLCSQMTFIMKKRPELTKEIIEDAKGDPSRKSPKLLGDSNGLYLQVTPGGVRSWIFRYTINKRTRSMGLGPVRTLTLVAARKKAMALRVQVDQGIDPLARKAQELAVMKAAEPIVHRFTFRKCAEAYLNSHDAGWKNKKSPAQWRNTLEQYAYPFIGNKAVQDIAVGDVIKVIDPIWTRINETASRLRGRIEKILGWATVLGYRSGENPARWAGYLSEVFTKRSAVRTVKHHSALPYKEMPDFMRKLKAEQNSASLLLQIIILTATRTGEARGALWSEIDFDEKLWTIPAERMKASREHRIPLSEPVIALLTQIKDVNDRIPTPSKFVFPGGKAGKCLSDGAAIELLKRMERPDVTPHGMRSTMRDWAAEGTTFQREVAEAALAHKLRDKTEAAYQRGDFLEKRRAFMAAWGSYCLGEKPLTEPISHPHSEPQTDPAPPADAPTGEQAMTTEQQ